MKQDTKYESTNVLIMKALSTMNVVRGNFKEKNPNGLRNKLMRPGLQMA